MIFNAIIGAVVSVLSSSVIGPLGPILGGGVAGYLERQDGPTVGTLSGVIASLPLVVLVFFAGAFFLFIPEQLLAGVGVLIAIVAFVIIVLVSGLLGALGGYLGVYVRSETGTNRAASRSRRR